MYASEEEHEPALRRPECAAACRRVPPPKVDCASFGLEVYGGYLNGGLGDGSGVSIELSEARPPCQYSHLTSVKLIHLEPLVPASAINAQCVLDYSRLLKVRRQFVDSIGGSADTVACIE